MPFEDESVPGWDQLPHIYQLLRDYCGKIRDGDDEFVYENRELIEAEFAIASKVLTGYPVYGRPEVVEKMRDEVRSLI